MATLRKKQNNGNAGGGAVSELEALKAQRAELAGRLAATEAQARDCDPLDDWERLSALATEAQALERAIAAADRRIDEAVALAAATAREEREAATVQRKLDALQTVMAISEQIAVQAQQWDGGLLADLEAAVMELHHAGGYPTAAAAPALSIGKAIDKAIEGWCTVAPQWLGLDPPPTREEVALRERRAMVERAEKLLQDARDASKKARNDGGNPYSRETLQSFAHGVVAARRQLLYLTDPDLPETENFRRSTAGMDDLLSEYVGRFWEGQHDMGRKKQREAAALALAA